MGCVWVLAAGVHLELRELRAPKASVGKHSAHGTLDEALGVGAADLPGGSRLEPTGSLRAISIIDLVLFLAPSKPNPGGVQNNHVVTAIEERGPGRFVFSDQHPRHTAGEAAESLIPRIYHEPAALDFAGAREGCTCRTGQGLKTQSD